MFLLHVFGFHSLDGWLLVTLGISLLHDLSADLELRDLLVELIIADILPLASVLPVVVDLAPLFSRLSGKIVSLFVDALIDVEVDLSTDKLGLTLGEGALSRLQRLVGLLQSGGWRLCGHLARIILGANLAHVSTRSF